MWINISHENPEDILVLNQAFWRKSHLCCPDATDLSRLTLVGWWGARLRSWIPLVCPGKTLARLPQAPRLAASLWPRLSSGRPWWGRSRWTERATGSRWSRGCCIAPRAGPRVRFLCGDTGLETGWNYRTGCLALSCNWAQGGRKWHCLKASLQTHG